MNRRQYFVLLIFLIIHSFSLRANETLFGNITIKGEKGERQVVLVQEGVSPQVLVDEKKLLLDIKRLEIPEEEKEKILFEARNMFEEIPSGIAQTGIDVTNEMVDMTAFASVGGRMDEILSGEPCDSSQMSQYLDVPIESEERGSLDIKVPKKFAEKFTIQPGKFFNLGEILSISAMIDTTNDNPLHGGLQTLGVTEFGEGIEGDDRGFTFGMTGEVKVEFEEGSMAFNFFSNLYSRLATQEINGRATLFDPDTGNVFTENLNHEGIRVSFVRNLGDTYFMRLEGEYSVLDDVSGLALDSQTMWHDKWEANTIIYDHIDHFDKQRIMSSNLGIGRRDRIFSSENIELSSTLEAGVGTSNLGNIARNYNRTLQTSAGRFGAPTEIEGVNNLSTYVAGDLRADLYGFDTTIYGRVDTNETKVYGIDSGYTFNKGGTHEVRLSIGVSHDENVFTDIYQNDINDSNLTHHVGIGYRLNF